jgi:hypothetical protein
MGNERKFQDHEIRQILDLAIRQEDGPAHDVGSAQSLGAPGDGLTLVQLQEVGREVGLPPERIAQAVATFDRGGERLPRATTLGLSTSVGRMVPLPRNLTDREWELLVVELRTTFGVKGEARSEGNIREWTHAYLQVFVEPTPTGYRLRMVDSTAGIVGIVGSGLVLAFALMIFGILLGKGSPGFLFAVPALIGLLGGVGIVGSVRFLLKWAPRQEERMEHLSRYAASIAPLPGPNEE